MSCFRQKKVNEAGRVPFLRRAVSKIPCFGPAKESSNQIEEDQTEPGGASGSAEVSESARAPEPDEAPVLSRAEVERAEFGLKVLYDCDDAEVDIVTIHGLNGHRERTFTATNGICWLNSLLPEKIQKIRVISYGYDARTHSSSPLSREHLHDHAEQVVEALTRKRDVTNTTNRPIVFIAHSLGGIVVKSALILSASFNSSHRESQKAISLSTHGILFMGTPHAGGEGVSWGKLALNLASIVKHTKQEFLDVLERNSQWLEQQQAQYNSISSKFDTKFFYEMFETLLPGGGKLLVVPKHSACVAGARDAVVIGMSSDHSNMVKFGSAEEDGFITVVETLEIMLREAAQKVDSNWQEWKTIKAIGEVQEISYSVPMSLPLRRNQNFTGRQGDLHKIHAVLQGTELDVSHQRVMVLYGLGGIGKTQLAAHYAYTHENNYTSVWWVNANTTAALSQDFLGIAQDLVSYHAKGQISKGQNPDYSRIATMLGVPSDIIDQAGKLTTPMDTKPIIQAVKSWLASKDNQKWLLIVDNYDDLQNVDITGFLPRSPGSVIITSRAKESQRLGVGLEVEEVKLEDGIEILRKSAGTTIEEFDKERSDAIEIVQKLGSLPLALDQAGAYINSMQIPYNQYLPRFDCRFATIAGKRPSGSTWQYREDTIFTTWEISFAALGLGAQALLLLCGFLDNEDIWEGLLLSERLKIELGIDSVDDAIQEIFSLSLAKRKNTSDSFWIHSMVHRWSRERLDRVEREGKASTAILLTSAVLLFDDDREALNNLQLERRMMPHIEMCSNHVWYKGYLNSVETDLVKIEEVKILSRVLRYHRMLDHAEKLSQWVLIREEKALGKDHPSTLTTVHNMASVFDNQGRYDEALEWYRRALAGDEKALGKDHPSTLTTVHNMASVFDNQGRYDEALEWYRRVLAGNEKALGKDHPSTLTTVHNMALVFGNQGRYDEALEWYGRALAGKEKALGKDHPSTLTTVHNMASVFKNQGRYDEALEWYGRALAGREKALGKDHPKTAASRNRLRALTGSRRHVSGGI